MFKRWNEKLKQWVGGIGTSVKDRLRAWGNEGWDRPLPYEFRNHGFPELTPLEEAWIRTGQWNPRW